MGSESGDDFGFAFNNVTFSDRLLRIEISRGGEVSCSSVVEWVRDRKRRREDVNNNHIHTNVLDLATISYDNNKHDDEAMVMTEQQSQSDVSECYCKPTRVKEIHVSSPILAAKSPFFYKLFSNGMLESEQKHLTLKIDASEEAALIELLRFMYTNSLSVTAIPALLDILMVADKFQVASCMMFCSRLLLSMPMTLDFSLLLLHLPSNLLMADHLKPLTNAARQFLAFRYKEISKFPLEELMALPLVGLETILANDDLQIASEDIAYELVLIWSKSHYPLLEERQEILGSHLARFIRFPHMSCSRLKRILTSNDFKPSVASKIVLEALCFKAESMQYRSTSRGHRFIERNYKHRPIKIVEFEAPRRHCIVYLDLKYKECLGMDPSGRIYSQVFHLGGQGFFLSAHCNMDQLGVFRCFGLFLGMQEKGSGSLTVDYEFSARSKPTEEFVGKYKGTYKFTNGKAVGYRNLFSIPWETFICNDCPYFINDVLHLRAELSFRP